MFTDDSQNVLQNLWLGGKEGSLCGREQARAWALREEWKDAGKSDYGMLSHIAGKIRTTKNGRPKGPHPCTNSVKDLFQRIDKDCKR